MSVEIDPILAKVGDRIIRYKLSVGGWNTPDHPNEWVIHEVELDRFGTPRSIRVTDEKTGRNSAFWDSSLTGVKFEVERGYTQGKVAGTTTVRVEDLRVDDVVDSWVWSDGTTGSPAPEKWTISRITFGHGGKLESVNYKMGGVTDYWFWRKTSPRPRQGQTLQVRVFRNGAARAVPTPAAKVIDEYPGKCTRCGRDAYLGAFEVAHRDETAARDCPARRK